MRTSMSSAKNLIDEYLKNAGYGPRTPAKSEPQQPAQQPIEGESAVSKYLREKGFGPKPAN